MLVEVFPVVVVFLTVELDVEFVVVEVLVLVAFVEFTVVLVFVVFCCCTITHLLLSLFSGALPIPIRKGEKKGAVDGRSITATLLVKRQ